MSERKVLQKYFPPDWDPRDIVRHKGSKNAGPRIQTVRLMAPFSMRCTTCGEFIYKGRKFNSRKETPDVKYLNIQIFYFHIKCTRCSAPIMFCTDPKNSDYAMMKGAVRNMEPWRNRDAEEETVEQRLDRLEKEEAEAEGEEEKNAMADLEAKNVDAQREMAAADALDEIRYRNARIHQSEKEGTDYADTVIRMEDEERRLQDLEDETAARKAFATTNPQVMASATDDDIASSIPLQGVKQSLKRIDLTKGNDNEEKEVGGASASPLSSIPSFKRVVKIKKDHSKLLGIKKKPSLV